jgi:hypothetical protein
MQQQIIHNMHSDQIEYNRVAHAAHRDQQHNKQSLFSHISKLRGSQRLLTSIAGPHIPPATSKDSGASGTNNSSRCFDSATTERRVNKDACERRKAAMTADSWPRPPSMRTYIHTHIHTQSLYLSHSLIFSLSLSLSLSLSRTRSLTNSHTHHIRQLGFEMSSPVRLLVPFPQRYTTLSLPMPAFSSQILYTVSSTFSSSTAFSLFVSPSTAVDGRGSWGTWCNRGRKTANYCFRQRSVVV